MRALTLLHYCSTRLSREYSFRHRVQLRQPTVQSCLTNLRQNQKCFRPFCAPPLQAYSLANSAVNVITLLPWEDQ